MRKNPPIKRSIDWIEGWAKERGLTDVTRHPYSGSKVTAEISVAAYFKADVERIFERVVDLPDIDIVSSRSVQILIARTVEPIDEDEDLHKFDQRFVVDDTAYKTLIKILDDYDPIDATTKRGQNLEFEEGHARELFTYTDIEYFLEDTLGVGFNVEMSIDDNRVPFLRLWFPRNLWTSRMEKIPGLKAYFPRKDVNGNFECRVEPIAYGGIPAPNFTNAEFNAGVARRFYQNVKYMLTPAGRAVFEELGIPIPTFAGAKKEPEVRGFDLTEDRKRSDIHPDLREAMGLTENDDEDDNVAARFKKLEFNPRKRRR